MHIAQVGLVVLGFATSACSRGNATVAAEEHPMTTPGAPMRDADPPAKSTSIPDPDPVQAESTTDGTCSTVDQCAQIIAHETDRDKLEAAGVWLASQGDPAAVRVLGESLGQAEFLTRLDEVETQGNKTYHLSRIFGVLERNPIPEVATQCLALAEDSEFVADPDRILFLLQAAAAVRPMRAETVALFRRTNAQDYAPFNAILLGNNASPEALALLETMLLDAGIDVVDRVESIHNGLLPVRTELPVLELVGRMLRRKLPAALEVALVETMFDYQSAKWFGKRHSPPRPPPWTAASEAALKRALKLAASTRARKRLPSALKKRVAKARVEIQAALDAK